MIKGKIAKFQPLKTGEVSVLITTTKDCLYELVDMQVKDTEITIQAMQNQLPIQADRKQLLSDISTHMQEIKQILSQIYPEEYNPEEGVILSK